jgi:phage-related tail fiber protein
MATTANTVITKTRRKNLAQASAGIISLPVITGMAFGDGGVDSSGNVKPPTEEQTALYHEIYRQKVDNYMVASDTSVRYTCTLADSILTDKNISEIALYDSAGSLVCIRTMSAKGKDEGMEMTFTLDDEF